MQELFEIRMLVGDMTNELVSKVEASKFFGVTTQGLDRWFADGCPVEERDESGSIKRLNLRRMEIWRDNRDRWRKLNASQQDDINHTFEFVCRFVCPMLIQDTILRIREIADDAGVPIEHAKAVWAEISQMMFFTVMRLFYKNEDEVNFHLPQCVVDEVRAVGELLKTRKNVSVRNGPNSRKPAITR